MLVCSCNGLTPFGNPVSRYLSECRRPYQPAQGPYIGLWGNSYPESSTYSWVLSSLPIVPSNSESLTGFNRKAAPPAVRTFSPRPGSSRPVITITGKRMPVATKSRCTSSPVKLGICKSRIKQSGCRCLSDSRNCCPDKNVSTSKPTERKRRPRDLHTSASSSTTAICHDAPARDVF
jgi:hypothetical protein